MEKVSSWCRWRLVPGGMLEWVTCNRAIRGKSLGFSWSIDGWWIDGWLIDGWIDWFDPLIRFIRLTMVVAILNRVWCWSWLIFDFFPKFLRVENLKNQFPPSRWSAIIVDYFYYRTVVVVVVVCYGVRPSFCYTSLRLNEYGYGAFLISLFAAANDLLSLK